MWRLTIPKGKEVAFLLAGLILGSACLVIAQSNLMEVEGDLAVDGNLDVTGNVGIGTISPGNKLEVEDGGASTHTIVEIVNANDSASFKSVLQGKRARGTLASPSALQSGDTILSIFGALYDGTGYKSAGEISFEVDATPGSNDWPTRIVFETTADNSGVRLERMRIDDQGWVGIGTTSTEELLTLDSEDAFAIGAEDEWTPSTDSDFAKLYGEEGELWVLDGSGNNTRLSSHTDPREIDPYATSSFADPNTDLPFSFHHSNHFIGRGAVVDLAEALSDLENLTGKTYTHVYDMSPEEIIHYAEWQATQQAESEMRAMAKILEQTPEVEISIEDAWENVPVMEVVETVEQVTEYAYDLDPPSVFPVTVDRTIVSEVPTGQTIPRLKEDVRFDETTGKLYRRRTLDEVEPSEIPAPELPQWIADRLPPLE